MRLTFRDLLMNMGPAGQRFNSIKDAISHGDWGYDWAKHFIERAELSKLFSNIEGEVLSPFEAACYYSNPKILTLILDIAKDYPNPKEQVNKAFSHAIWRGHPDILVILLNTFDYTFDSAEFAQVQSMAKNHTALREKISELNKRDYDFAKSLALLLPLLQTSADVTKYLCQFLPVLTESRGPEILNALRSFQKQDSDPAHQERLKSFQALKTLGKSVESLSLQERLHKVNEQDPSDLHCIRAKL